jgi:hypothetical protein
MKQTSANIKIPTMTTFILHHTRSFFNYNKARKKKESDI